MLSERNARIGTLTVRNATENDPALRLSLDRLLNSVDFQLPGLPPAAVLVVRRLADPLPGRLSPYGAAIRVDGAWERALRNSLTDFYQRASRPVNGVLSADCEAVLFADEGMMLACLVLDVSRGVAHGHWWWRQILRTLPSLSAGGLTMHLCRQARLVPAGLSYLIEWGQAVTVVNTLSPAQAMMVLAAVSRAHGLGDLDLGQTTGPAEEGTRAPVRRRLSTSEPDAGTRKPADGRAPWERWLPSRLVPRTLTRERICLLGVGLTVHRRPAIAQSRGFLHSVREWWAGSLTAATGAPDALPALSPQIGSQVPVATGESEASLSSDGEMTGAHGKQETGVGAMAHPQPGSPPTLAGQADPQESGSSASRLPAGGQADRAARQEPATQPHREPEAPVAQDAMLRLKEGVVTAVGGVLYLINLMRHLDLPACFEDNWGLASLVGAWGVLEVLGRALLVRAGDDLTRDSVWQALAELDGRKPGEFPGQVLRSCDTFRLPAPWLDQLNALENLPWDWATDGRRLRLWSERGYLLVESPCPGGEFEARAQAGEEIRAYLGDTGSEGTKNHVLTRNPFDQAPLDGRTGPLVRGLNPDLARWLARVLPFIRFRLRHALNPAGDELWDLARALLLVSGRLYVTPSHVDLVMNLDDVSLPVRLAGLDVDPGWVADFGRVIRFHFE